MLYKQTWSEVGVESILCADSIVDKYRDDSSVRVSAYRFAAEEKIGGRTVACSVYVVRGMMVFSCDDDVVRVGGGDVLSFSGGTYHIVVDGCDDVECVWVWAIPSELKAGD